MLLAGEARADRALQLLPLLKAQLHTRQPASSPKLAPACAQLADVATCSLHPPAGLLQRCASRSRPCSSCQRMHKRAHSRTPRRCLVSRRRTHAHAPLSPNPLPLTPTPSRRAGAGARAARRRRREQLRAIHDLFPGWL